MADQARARRLAVRIREIVASTLENQVKDPRLGMVTITDARVTPDLRDATLYYTVYGDEAARADSAAALESARGVLRTEVGRQTGIKFTPTLAFVPDAVPEQAAGSTSCSRWPGTPTPGWPRSGRARRTRATRTRTGTRTTTWTRPTTPAQ